MLEKDHEHAPEKACADILCLESFSLSSAGDNLRGGFHQNIHQVFRCIFSIYVDAST